MYHRMNDTELIPIRLDGVSIIGKDDRSLWDNIFKDLQANIIAKSVTALQAFRLNKDSSSSRHDFIFLYEHAYRQLILAAVRTSQAFVESSKTPLPAIESNWECASCPVRIDFAGTFSDLAPIWWAIM